MSKKKQIRESFRESVFSRDGYKCVFCNRMNDLDAHHITDRNEMPNGGYVVENGITLCPIHHTMAEQFHSSGGLFCHEGFRPTDLYNKIKSGYNLAYKKSKELE